LFSLPPYFAVTVAARLWLVPAVERFAAREQDGVNVADAAAWLGGVTTMAVTVGIGIGLLLGAAWHDLRTRLIPDTISLILGLLGLAYRSQFGLIEFAFSITTSLLLFFLLFAAFNRGVVGGGDVKLAVATGLWLSPPDCYVFLVVTALAGGLLALLHLGLRTCGRWAAPDEGEGIRLSGGVDVSGEMGVGGPPAKLASATEYVAGAGSGAVTWIRAELARIRRREPMPYGVAIAAGGCYGLLMSLAG